jgi:hypothetical protein
MSKLNYFLEDGSEVVDNKFGDYNKGTQLMLEILVEQGCEFESHVQYGCLVNDLEECRDQDDVEEVMYEMGTDYIDEMEVHIDWMDLMFPRVTKSPYFTYVGDEVVS